MYSTAAHLLGDIEGVTVQATHHSGNWNPNETWDVFGDFANLPQMREKGWFYVGYVEIPITDGTVLDFRAEFDGDMFAVTDAGEEATLTWTGSTFVWGYVMAVGEDLTPGDFNADGNVDADDYQLWTEESFLADANQNGVTDGADLAVWAANADAILVSTNVDENDSNYSYGDLSLREAIALAADVNHPGEDIITFDESLFGSTITLTSALTISGSNEVKILGPGVDQLTIDGNGANITLFNVTGGGATISNLKIANTGVSGRGVVHADSTGNRDLLLDSVEIVRNGIGLLK